MALTRATLPAAAAARWPGDTISFVPSLSTNGEPSPFADVRYYRCHRLVTAGNRFAARVYLVAVNDVDGPSEQAFVRGEDLETTPQPTVQQEFESALANAVAGFGNLKWIRRIERGYTTPAADLEAETSTGTAISRRYWWDASQAAGSELQYEVIA